MVFTFNTLLVLLSIPIAYYLFVKNKELPNQIANINKPLYNFLINKWYFDELYEVFLLTFKKIGLFLWKFCDVKLIDGLVLMEFHYLLKNAQLKQVNFKVDLYISMLYYAVRFFCFINFSNCKIMNFPILSSLILLPSIGALFLFFTKIKMEII